MRALRENQGILDRIRGGIRLGWAVATGSALPPWDDYYYSRPGWDSAAGMSVTPESAMQLAAVFACVRVVSETLASLPLIIYKQLPDGSKVRAIEHPLYHVLHDTPNQWQTSMEFIEMMQAHLELRGNAFARILPGPRGAIDQLVPLHPDLVQVYRLPNGKLKYQVRSRFTSEVNWYVQDEIFHLRGLSSDGLVGLSPIALQRETVGKGLGMQDYGSRFFENDATATSWIGYPGKFKDDAAREKFRENWRKSQTGPNRFKTPVLEDGMSLKQIGISNKDSQFLEATAATNIDICGFYRVQPHKIGILDRTTHSNIEQQNIEFTVDTMRPRAVRWERRINVDLIDPLNEVLGGDYFAEFLIDGLMRGDMKSRFDAYHVARGDGFVCPNDIARLENWNPISAKNGGNTYWRPANMVPADAPIVVQQQLPPGDVPEQPDDDEQTSPPPRNSPAPEELDDEGHDAPKEQESARGKLLRMFAADAARRVVRKEVTALRKSLARAGKQFDAAAFAAEARDFYAAHQALVAQTMCISPAAANRYVTNNLKLLVAAEEPTEKSCALDWIEDTAPESLAELALGKKEGAQALAPR
jgi:HK97 family phage portal protein